MEVPHMKRLKALALRTFLRFEIPEIFIEFRTAGMRGGYPGLEIGMLP
jgi:hypothetical protein